MLKSNPLLLILALATAAFGLASCGQDDPVVAPVAGDETALRLADKSGTSPFETQQEFLSWVYNLDNYPQDEPSYQYEDAIRGLVSVTGGGFIYGHPASWPSDYGFSYKVLPGSMDLSAVAPDDVIEVDGELFVEIIVQVPVLATDFPCDNAPMPLKLYPDHLKYKTDIDPNTGELGHIMAELTVSYHPNLEMNCGKPVVFGSVDEDDGLYYTAEFFVANTTVNQVLTKAKAIRPIIDPSIVDGCSQNIYVEIWHHSKWVLEEDTGPDGTIDPIVDTCLQF